MFFLPYCFYKFPNTSNTIFSQISDESATNNNSFAYCVALSMIYLLLIPKPITLGFCKFISEILCFYYSILELYEYVLDYLEWSNSVLLLI